MPSFSTKRHVPHTAAQMYALVADVERYPEFLPMCTALTILSRTPLTGGEDLVATMSVGYKSITETFTTNVRLRPVTHTVEAAYIDGPFKHLDNRWRLIDEPGGGSTVDFDIDYAFKSAMLGLLAGAVFDQAFRKFAEAFEARARQVYGDPTTS